MSLMDHEASRLKADVNQMKAQLEFAKDEINRLRRRVLDLEKDSHPPIDIVERIMQAFMEGQFDDIMRQKLQLPPYNE
jgi:hypothetical protein